MRRALVAVITALAVLAGGPAAGAAKPKPKPAPKAKVKCHWVKATKKRKRHKVCVKVKAKKKPAPAKKAPAAPVVPAPVPAPAADPAAPDAGVPAPAPGPVVAPPEGDPAAPAPGPVAARVQVTAREWTLQLSRPSIAAGAVILQLVNRGEDPHDLHARPAGGGADLLAIGQTDGFGTVADTSGTLPAGSYTLYCSLPGHEAAGMHATLTVQ
jgi:plastocyanin